MKKTFSPWGTGVYAERLRSTLLECRAFFIKFSSNPPRPLCVSGPFPAIMKYDLIFFGFFNTAFQKGIKKFLFFHEAIMLVQRLFSPAVRFLLCVSAFCALTFFGIWENKKKHILRGEKGALLKNIACIKKEQWRKHKERQKFPFQMRQLYSQWGLTDYTSSLSKALWKLTRRYHIHVTRYHIFPSVVLWQGENKLLQKTKISLDFCVKNDDNFWLFFQHLHQSFPGIILSVELALIAQQNAEQKAVCLKGSYQFECYNMCAFSTKSFGQSASF